MPVGVMDKSHEARSAPAICPLEHLQVAVGASESKNRFSPDKSLDANRLSSLVVHKIHAGQLHKYRLVVAIFQFQLAHAADDLLRRNSINVLDPRAHELNTAAGHDVRLETIGVQV